MDYGMTERVRVSKTRFTTRGFSEAIRPIAQEVGIEARSKAYPARTFIHG
jgi:hypothetical protein